MPKKKRKSGKSNKRVVLVIAVVAVIAVSVVAWHDGLIGVTSIGDINSGDVSTGTKVTVKGELTFIFQDVMTITDDDGNSLAFTWDGDKPALGSIVVVRGEVTSFITLGEVTSVDAVWLLR